MSTFTISRDNIEEKRQVVIQVETMEALALTSKGDEEETIADVEESWQMASDAEILERFEYIMA